MEKVVVNGIQQVGLGCQDLEATSQWYRDVLGMDIRIFEDEGTAELMSRYTGGISRRRRSLLAMNLNGGGGLHYWQHLSKDPSPPTPSRMPGDIGINALRLRVYDMATAKKRLAASGVGVSDTAETDPEGREILRCRDLNGNELILVSDDWRFDSRPSPIGGVMGVSLGVSSIDASMRFYRQVLGYAYVGYDVKEIYGEHITRPLRRVLLRRPPLKIGGFGALLGPTEIELVECLDSSASIEGKFRFWGDPGLMHLCFDIKGMDALRRRCQAHGHPFFVDSRVSISIGKNSGHFSYCEDPDGLLIQFVETHKVALFPTLGLHIDLSKIPDERPLPDWKVKLLRFKRF